MYIYRDIEKIRRKKTIVRILLTFIFAVIGSYLVQTYLTNRIGAEDYNNVQRLSNESEENYFATPEYSKEDIIEEAMKSVVGISIIKANEESIFDVSLPEKWGLRNWSHSIRKWIYIN